MTTKFKIASSGFITSEIKISQFLEIVISKEEICHCYYSTGTVEYDYKRKNRNDSKGQIYDGYIGLLILIENDVEYCEIRTRCKLKHIMKGRFESSGVENYWLIKEGYTRNIENAQLWGKAVVDTKYGAKAVRVLNIFESIKNPSPCKLKNVIDFVNEEEELGE